MVIQTYSKIILKLRDREDVGEDLHHSPIKTSGNIFQYYKQFNKQPWCFHDKNWGEKINLKPQRMCEKNTLSCDTIVHLKAK